MKELNVLESLERVGIGLNYSGKICSRSIS